jgi:hypothetical protein
MHSICTRQIFQNSIREVIERYEVFLQKRTALFAFGLRVFRRGPVHLDQQPRLDGPRAAGAVDLHLRQHCIKLQFQIAPELNSQFEAREIPDMSRNAGLE